MGGGLGMNKGKGGVFASLVKRICQHEFFSMSATVITSPTTQTTTGSPSESESDPFLQLVLKMAHHSPDIRGIMFLSLF